MASADPITEFLNAVERAKAHQVDTAPVVLATADEQGRPSARLVLLRGADAGGFVFFTNYDSRKGRELTDNPHAALCFYWSSLDEQIRVEGRVERVTSEESDVYFAGRPRGSQLGAWASDQSQVLSSRETLEMQVRIVAPDAAMVHSRFRVSGDVEEDGKAVAREGVGIRVVRKVSGRWRTVAVQNTDVRNRRT